MLEIFDKGCGVKVLEFISVIIIALVFVIVVVVCIFNITNGRLNEAIPKQNEEINGKLGNHIRMFWL